MEENILKTVVKNFFAREIELSKKQATKEFVQSLDKIVDKSIEDFVRIVLQAIRDEER